MVDGVRIHRSLFIEAGPGHPVCAQCARPVEVDLDDPNATHSRCGGCGETAVYGIPHKARRYNPSLAGVAAADHRTDRPQARMEAAAGGPISLKCPECAGSLDPGDQALTRCPFCSTTVWIPSRARVHDLSAPPRPALWWIAFRGPSVARAAIEAGSPFETDETQTLKRIGQKFSLRGASAEKPLSQGDPLERAPRRGGVHWGQLIWSSVATTAALIAGLVIALIIRSI
jgi:hypothetical protein